MQDITTLTAEREQLLARLAEIDAQLAAQAATENAEPELPEGYFLQEIQRGRLGWYWMVSKGKWKHESRDRTQAIRTAIEHRDNAPARIARAAERAAEAEAEAERIAAQEAARAAAERAKLATPRQVEFIMTLLAEREFKLIGPGFVVGGPTERSEVEKLTKEKASAYISSLKDQY